MIDTAEIEIEIVGPTPEACAQFCRDFAASAQAWDLKAIQAVMDGNATRAVICFRIARIAAAAARQVASDSGAGR